MITDAIILAAGRGARLDRPGTPKPLVDVGGEPLIGRLIRQLEAAGVARIAVVVGYEGAAVSRALRARPGVRAALEIVENPAWEAGQGTSVLAARGAVRGPFLLAMADHVFSDAHVAAAAALDPEELDASAVAVVDTRIAEIPALEDAVLAAVVGDRIAAIGRGLKSFNAVDAGLFAATPAIFDAAARAMEAAPDAELCDALDLVAAAGRLYASKMEGGAWDDVDTPAALVRAELRLRRERRQDRVVSRRRELGLCAATLEAHALESEGRRATRVEIGRGIVADPGRTALIPDESASSPCFVFTDEIVHELHGRRFVEGLRTLGYDVQCLVLPVGEGAKSMANYAYLVERVLSRGVDERSVFLSLGGGVICNVCGFVASTLYRGMDLVHLPTTLMAQCDAAISHKQGINGARGKNLVGTYFAPRLVAVDIDALATLSDPLIADGMSEVVKHALGEDAAYAQMLLGHEGSARDPEFLEAVVSRNVALKCALMRADPHEHREGMVLQYGHTVGHAVEHLSGYRLSHGQSVAVGMMVAAWVSVIMGGARRELVEAHARLLSKYGLPTRMPRGIAAADVVEAVRYGKRYLTEGTRMALLGEVGSLWRVDGEFAIPVSDQVLAQAVDLAAEESPWKSESRSSRAPRAASASRRRASSPPGDTASSGSREASAM
jgi:3-dehydroquinate synthase